MTADRIDRRPGFVRACYGSINRADLHRSDRRHECCTIHRRIFIGRFVRIFLSARYMSVFALLIVLPALQSLVPLFIERATETESKDNEQNMYSSTVNTNQ
jgi:hypothetical protein